MRSSYYEGPPRRWWHAMAHRLGVIIGECIDSNGVTSYYECGCGERCVIQRGGGYQPVNWDWLLRRHPNGSAS